MATVATRLGVDIGGTFTDLVLEVAGDRFSTKVLTTYASSLINAYTGVTGHRSQTDGSTKHMRSGERN